MFTKSGNLTDWAFFLDLVNVFINKHFFLLIWLIRIIIDINCHRGAFRLDQYCHFAYLIEYSMFCYDVLHSVSWYIKQTCENWQRGKSYRIWQINLKIYTLTFTFHFSLLYKTEIVIFNVRSEKKNIFSSFSQQEMWKS